MQCLCVNNGSSARPICLAFNEKHVVLFKNERAKMSLLCRSSSEENEFEVDQDKAKEALKQLDQQFQSISEKQIRSPKIKASDVISTSREQATSEEDPSDFSTPFFAYGVGFLVLFTIIYNIIFITVIKPAYDTPVEPETEDVSAEMQSVE